MTDEELEDRLSQVREQIADAARDAGRSPEELTTVVVTKFHPGQLVRRLHALGVRDFGESRHQEAAPKVSRLSDLDAHWHFVGQVQSKKARQVRDYAHVIHSVDRESLLRALSSDEGPEREIFVQVNLTEDAGRGGVAPGELEPFVEHALTAPGLRLLGLMAVAPLGESARRAFATVRMLSERIRSLAPEATALSMGMSGDFREAVAEGATHLRIGTAITGNRPDRP